MREWTWLSKPRILKRLRYWYKEDGPADVFQVPEAKAEQIDAFIAHFTEWHEKRSDRAWYEYQMLAAENEALRFKLDWLMKQPALQHYAVQLDVGEPRPKLDCGEEPKPPKFDE